MFESLSLYDFLMLLSWSLVAGSLIGFISAQLKEATGTQIFREVGICIVGAFVPQASLMAATAAEGVLNAFAAFTVVSLLGSAIGALCLTGGSMLRSRKRN